MYRFVFCLLFAATSEVAATTAPTTAPSVAPLIHVNYYQDEACTGNAFQTIVAPLNTCSCNSNTAGTCVDSYMKITLSGSDYTTRMYSDDRCQPSTGGTVVLSAGSCNSFMRATPNEVPTGSVLDCGPIVCTYRDSATNSASTTSTIASVGFLALVANVVYTNCCTSRETPSNRCSLPCTSAHSQDLV